MNAAFCALSTFFFFTPFCKIISMIAQLLSSDENGC